MNKPKNPYRRGSLLWQVYEGDWGDLTRQEIAYVLDADANIISSCFFKIKRDTGWIVPRKHALDRGGKYEDRPDAPFQPDSIIGRIFSGDWHDKTCRMIAEALQTSESRVRHCVWQIKDITGWIVPYIRLDAHGRPIKQEVHNAEN